MKFFLTHHVNGALLNWVAFVLRTFKGEAKTSRIWRKIRLSFFSSLFMLHMQHIYKQISYTMSVYFSDCSETGWRRIKEPFTVFPFHSDSSSQIKSLTFEWFIYGNLCLSAYALSLSCVYRNAIVSEKWSRKIYLRESCDAF